MNASDLRDQPLTLTIGGKDRPFRFSFASYELLTQRHENVEQVFQDIARWVTVPGQMMDRATVASVVDAIWAGLAPLDASVTREQVAGWLDLRNAVQAVLVIFEARKRSLPEADSEAEPSDPPAA